MRPSSEPTQIGVIIEEMIEGGFYGERGRQELLPILPATKTPTLLAWARDVALDEPKTLIPVRDGRAGAGIQPQCLD